MSNDEEQEINKVLTSINFEFLKDHVKCVSVEKECDKLSSKMHTSVSECD